MCNRKEEIFRTTFKKNPKNYDKFSFIEEWHYFPVNVVAYNKPLTAVTAL